MVSGFAGKCSGQLPFRGTVVNMRVLGEADGIDQAGSPQCACMKPAGFAL